jgi:hypothetical protein
MATADEYAAWIVQNADKRGTPEFQTVAQAYELAKQEDLLGQIPGATPEQAARAAVGYAPTVEEPETTPAGIAGAITRAAALPVAGTVAGYQMGGPYGAAIGGGAAVLAPVVADPLVELFNRTFGTNVQQPSQALAELLTRAGVPVPRTGVERFAGEATKGVTAGVAVPAAASRVATTLAAGTRAEPIVAPVAEAVRVGGMGPTGGATTAQRIGAGAISGGIGAVPVAEDPLDVYVGAAGGGLFPPVARAGREVVSGLWDSVISPILRPAQVAARQLFRAAGGTPQAAERAAAQIEAGLQVPTTPGFQPSVPELVVAGGGEAPPTIAVLAERIRGASPELVRETSQLMNQRVGALQGQLSRINQQIEQQGAMMRPGALEELTQARDAILRDLDIERAQFETTLRTSGAGLPTNPQELGEVISQRARELDRLFKSTEVNPRYEQALNLGGDAPNVDASGIAQAVENIYGRPLTAFAPKTEPRIVGILNRQMQAAEEEAPQLVTLRTMHDLRKAINAESRAANSAGNRDLAYNLGQLQTAVDDAINTAPDLSDAAKAAYRDATAFYRDVYVPKFRESETAGVLNRARFESQRIMPSEVVQAFTKNRDSARQFIRTFSDDPQAYDALRNGILGQFRLAALDPQTGIIDPRAAANFLQKNAEMLGELENAGLGVRTAMRRLEVESGQANQALENLRTIGAGFADKTPSQMLDYILSSGDRMGIALRRSDAQGQDAIRRVVQTRLNQMLTQTPGGTALTEADAMRVVREITDASGNLKSAYEQALGRDLAGEFADRARGLRLVIETANDPMLRNPNAIAPALRAQDFTPQQLTDIQLVIDDLDRARRVAAAAQEARAATSPTGRDILGEEGQVAAVRPDRLQLLDRTYTFLRNIYTGARDRLNPRIAARLANMLYNNPEEAIIALRNEAARTQRKARPAGVSRALPAAYGATYGGISTQVIERAPDQENQ